MRAVNDVLDVGLGESLIGVTRANVNRLRHESTRERDNRTGHRGREQHRVALFRCLCEQLFNIRKETEVEHAVGFVQNHDLNVGERQQFLTSEVEQTTGRPDDDLRPRFDFVDLFLV